jgi:pyruvate,orthophosphate dikinase
MLNQIYCAKENYDYIKENLSVFGSALLQFKNIRICCCDFANNEDPVDKISCDFPEDGYFSLFLSFGSLSSNAEDRILNIGLNDAAVQNEKDINKSFILLKKYISLIQKAVLLSEDTSKQYRELLCFELDGYTDILKAQNGLEHVKKTFERKKGFVFPQSLKEQLKLFMTLLINKTKLPKNIENSKSACRKENLFYIMLYSQDSVDKQEWYGTTVSRNIGKFPEKYFRTGTDDTISFSREQFSESAAAVSKELLNIVRRLEKIYKAVIKVRFFTVDESIVVDCVKVVKGSNIEYIASLLELFDGNIIDRKRFLELIDPDMINKVLVPGFKSDSIVGAMSQGMRMASGLGASDYAVAGKIVTYETLLKGTEKTAPLIMVKDQLLPDDFEIVNRVDGVITRFGSITSHPAVILRQLGKAFICGCTDMKTENGEIRLNNHILHEWDDVSIDGKTGFIYSGILEQDKGYGDAPEIKRLIDICKNGTKTKIYCNTENVQKAETSIRYGSDGIGLYRSEYMITGKGDLKSTIRDYILESDSNNQASLLQKAYELSKSEFDRIFSAVAGKVITIRTFDFPMHELMSDNYSGKLGGAVQRGGTNDNSDLEYIHEFNPMLGNRGCRLSILYPDLFKTQIRAVLSAYKDSGKKSKLKLLLPMIAEINEINVLKEMIRQVENEAGCTDDNIAIGIMVETPRIMFMIRKAAQTVDFLSFGTNDLTQLIWGISRDDSYRFLPLYISKKIIKNNPFVYLDREGVYEAVRRTISDAREANPDIEIGICGEQIYDNDSLTDMLKLDVNYISTGCTKVISDIIICAKHYSIGECYE